MIAHHSSFTPRNIQSRFINTELVSVNRNIVISKIQALLPRSPFYNPTETNTHHAASNSNSVNPELLNIFSVEQIHSLYNSEKTMYVRRTQPASGRIASALCVPCALTVRRMFFLIPCAWCLPMPLSPLTCTQRACCGCPPSRHPTHPSPLLLLSSDGIRRTHPQFPAPGPPAPYLLPLAT